MILVCFASFAAIEAAAKDPIPVPEKLVVLTFDDSSKTHYSTVRPILQQYGFGATFFITEGFEFASDKENYMTWDEIAALHRAGFEIGNHTRDHLAVKDDNLDLLPAQLKRIADQCEAHGIPRPVSFAYPGNAFTLRALPVLQQHDIRWARRGTEPERPYAAGHGMAYQIGLDHPLLIPTAGDARPDWTDDDFRAAIGLAAAGRIALLQFHGVPDKPHPWVSTDPAKFARWMRILKDEGYQVVALRDLQQYVPEGSEPNDPEMVLRDRGRRLAKRLPLFETRLPRNAAEWLKWSQIMDRHGFSLSERIAATGADAKTVQQYAGRSQARPSRVDRLEVLPYPGGRHPRLGFRDGAIRPQRETKVSVFTPWERDSYVVVDVPEAIWVNTPTGRRLLYLAHTHVPTIWDDEGVTLEKLEWEPTSAGGWKLERKLPNGVVFGTQVTPTDDALLMKMWLVNGTSETLTGLRVQNCAMLAHARGFSGQTNDNKQFEPPYAAVRNERGDKWIVFSWRPCLRAWGNTRVPCLHSDPQFPDCPPGERRELRGWLSFFEGRDIEHELRRIETLKWWETRSDD